MTKKSSLLILGAVLSCDLVWGQKNSYDTAIDDLAKEIAAELAQQGVTQVAVWNFVDIDGNQTDISKLVAEDFSVSLTNANGIRVMDRFHLKTLLKEHDLNFEGYIDEKTTMQIGKFSDVKAVVVGTVVIAGDVLRISVSGLETNEAMRFTSKKAVVKITPDIAAFLGVPGLGQASTSDINRGFNNVPLNSNEVYNSPSSVSHSCETNNTGDYCFKNITTNDLVITITVSPASNTLNGSVAYAYNSPKTITLTPGQTQCFYNLTAVIHSYRVTNPRINYPVGQGEIQVEKCKSKTFVID